MIQAHGLRREIGAIIAVDDVSLTVPAGTILALLGPNGAGKTTTVRMLAGLLAPTSGNATVAGCDVRADPAGVRARVGLVTDTPALHDQMSPRSYLDFFGRIYGLDAACRQQRIDGLLAFFDLQAVRSRRMAGFSRGMQQKVALARALLHEPAVLFLDEPTTGLDPLGARAVRDLVVSLKHASRSIVLCTHDLDEAERLADIVVILRNGRVVACDASAALRAAVAASTLVRVDLAAPCPAAAAIAARIDGVGDVCLQDGGVAGSTPACQTLTFRTTSPERTNPEVVAALIGVGARIVSVACTTATLEDVYARALGPEAVPPAGDSW
jgi:ABC-2 type transport system ATP-binding protein